MSQSDPTDNTHSLEAAEAADRLENKSQVLPLHKDPPSDFPLSPAASLPTKEQLWTVLGTLNEACISGDLVRVQSILAEYGEALYARDDFASALSFNLGRAAWEGHVEIVSYLLRYGTEMQNTPIWALRHKDTDTVIRVFEVLFSYGLDLRDFPGFITSGYVFVSRERTTLSNLA
jgi:hypothetical protein